MLEHNLLMYYSLLSMSYFSTIVIIFLITSIINSDIKNLKKKYVLIFSSIYVLYLIGVLFTTNIGAGVNDVMTKLSLLIFPVSFFFSKIDFLNKLNSTLKSFIEGCFVSVIISISVSALTYFYSLNLSSFFYGNLALF